MLAKRKFKHYSGAIFVFFLSYLFLGSILIFSLGCQKEDTRKPIRYVIPWPNQEGEYSLQTVEVYTLSRPDVLDGSAAKVYVRAGMNEGGEFVGDIAHPRLIKKEDGRYMAADLESAFAIATYAHFEKLQLFDRQLGIESHLSWPRRVGVDMKIMVGGEKEKNNALYVPKWDVTFVAPTDMEGLSMAFNAGVLAHEHFHAHFFSSVMKGLMIDREEKVRSERIDESGSLKRLEKFLQPMSLEKKMTPSLFPLIDKLLLRAWNEGLADFWGYLYSHDAQFMSKTYENGQKSRQLDRGPRLLPSKKEFIQQLSGLKKAENGCLNPFCHIYFLGSLLARNLKMVSDLSSEKLGEESNVDSHLILAKMIMTALPRLKSKLIENLSNDSAFLEPAEIIKLIFFSSSNKIHPEVCEILRESMELERWESVQSNCLQNSSSTRKEESPK